MRLAMVQMRIEPGAAALNMARAQEWIRRAAEKKADVVVLPEAMPFGWTDESARAEAESIPEGRYFQFLRTEASAHHIWICSGLIEREGANLYNSAVLIDSSGEVQLRHRKIHELDIAQGLYSRGDRLGVVPSAWGKLGLMICADAFVPGQAISRTLGCMGARIILSPCSWAVPAEHDNDKEPYGRLWFDNYGPVCRDYALWIAGVSNVGWIRSGAWAGWKCIGNSILMGPNGEATSIGPHGTDAEALLVQDLN